MSGVFIYLFFILFIFCFSFFVNLHGFIMRELKIRICLRYITMLDALEFMCDLFSFPSLSWILVFHNLLSVPSIYYIPSANDIPDKARGIEIYNSFEYERMRLHWNGCGLLLHELCHLIHQLALVQGL